MKFVRPLKVSINVDFKITLWNAIKLRIAGKSYTKIAEVLAEEIRKSFNDREQNDEM